MSGPSAEQKHLLVQRILGGVDPRLAPALREEFARPGPRPLPAPGQTVAIAGHRSAGKTRMLPLVSALLGRPGLDLDSELERRSRPQPPRVGGAGRQRLPRGGARLFLELPRGSLVALGGGFLAHHPEALEPCYTLLLPVSFETYRERLLRDTRRPRLRPGMTLEEELRSIYHQRQVLHARVPTVSLVDFLRAIVSPESQS